MGSFPAVAQEADVRLADIRIRGELAPFQKGELLEYLRAVPNRWFLGIPGVTPSLWLYQAGSPDTAFGRALQRAGEPPSLYDESLIEADRERLVAYYRHAGYLEADVLAEVEDVGEHKVRITYTIVPGPPSVLLGVTYVGLSDLTEDERGRLIRRSTLQLDFRREEGQPDTVYQVRPNQRLSEERLLDERRRLLDELRDLGYATVSRDSIRVIAFPRDTLDGGEPRFDIHLEIRTGQRYAFGDIIFNVSGPEIAPTRGDRFDVGDGQATVNITSENVLSPGLLRRSLQFEPGEVYEQSRLTATRRRLDRSGIFSFSEIVPLQGDVSGYTQADSLPRLSHQINLRTRNRHSIRLEGFILQRTGVFGGEGGGMDGTELGVGTGATYRNANTFGGGEQISLSANASVAGDFVDFPTAQFEGTASLALPYLVWPFGFVDRGVTLYDARTHFTLGFLTARRDELRLLIRGRVTAGFRLDLQHNPALTSFIDLIDFRLSDPDTLSGFRADFLDLIADPVAQQFVLEDYTRPQVNNALRYTLRTLTADPLRRDRGYSGEVSVELGGNLPYLLDRYVFTPGVVEGSIPGIPLFGDAGRLEYRQYLRGTIEGRNYARLSRISVLASRVAVGVAHPIGQAPVVPFDRRFYAGGAGSIRGWELRRLGPGRIPPEESAFVQGGDIQAEASLEFRHILFRRLFGADWQVAGFAETGNVWYGPRNPGDDNGHFRFNTFTNELAVGAGFGVRALWDFLILRLDFAWKVRSPIPGDPLFPEGNSPRLHFGIGQAF